MDSEFSLDLYHVKQYNKLPSVDSKAIRRSFASLGLSYKKQTCCFNTAPKTGSAGYNYLGTMKLVKELEKTFRDKVHIRNRVLVFSCPKKALQVDSWENFPWENASQNNVWIWSREMLEPTISALSPSQVRRD
jgi:hypothetical protein